MKWTRTLLLTIAASVAGGVAHAEEYFNSIGLSYGNIDQGERFKDSAGIPDTIETSDVMLQMVGQINKYFAVNVRLGASMEAEEITAGGQTLELEHEYFGGAYLRAQYRMSWLTPYAQAGFVRIKESVDLGGNSSSRKFTDASYAAGLDISMGDRWVINGEFFLLSDKNSVKRSGPTVGIAYRF